MTAGAEANQLNAIAQAAMEYIVEGSIVGLGTGRAASRFIQELGERVQGGLRVRGVPTSDRSAELARQWGIPLTSLDEVDHIDVDVDGADEVDLAGNLIKGYGGALVREKIVASASRKLIVLVGEEKLVPILGSRGRLPVEVLAFGMAWCQRRLKDWGFPAAPRLHGGQLELSDNGNPILDCLVPPLEDPASLEAQLVSLPGVVGTGLFLNMADAILIQRGERVETRQRLKV